MNTNFCFACKTVLGVKSYRDTHLCIKCRKAVDALIDNGMSEEKAHVFLSFQKSKETRWVVYYPTDNPKVYKLHAIYKFRRQVKSDRIKNNLEKNDIIVHKTRLSTISKSKPDQTIVLD